VTVLDVGQGLSVVLETQNHTMLYDAGPSFPSGFNTGEAVVLPYLKARNVAKVDLAIVSHNDNDHSGGIQPLIDMQVISTLMISNQPDLYKVESVQFCRAGQRWVWDEIEFEILHPPEHWESNKNNCW